MADEPRRSGRATKGQHKNLELAESQPAKRKGNGKAKGQKQTSNEPTPAPPEEEEIIRCICGKYEEEEDVERDMICCDKCSAWQHNDCMGLTFGKGEVPDQYFCEQCKPENHKDLLDKIAQGEKPWEEAAKRRAQVAEEKKARRRKGGKRGKKATARPSDVKSEVSDNASARAATTPSVETAAPAQDEKNGGAPAVEQGPSSSQKRKFEEPKEAVPQEQAGPKPKLQRLSTGGQATSPEGKALPMQPRKSSSVSATPAQGQKGAMSPTTPVISSQAADSLSAGRRNVANAMAKVFVEQAALAESRGTFSVPEGQTRESVGEALGLAIEQALYKNLCGGSGEPNEAYKQQFRTIQFNVKKNAALRDRLLVGTVSPDAISKMSTQDMASEELRQKDDEIKREAERQHIIIQEQGPRIRRTHKGEELVENDSQLVGTESVFSGAPARRDTIHDSEKQGAMSPGARAASPGMQQEPEFKEYRGSFDAGQHQSPPHSSDTQAPTRERRPSSSTFNIQNVWSSVQSPGSAGSQSKPLPPSASYREATPTHKVQADAEIDQLLKGEEVESPPYSPKDFSSDDMVWRGRLGMASVADFTAGAKHVAGADLSGRVPWDQLMPRTLVIDGRIDIRNASNYLCGLRFSQSTDVCVAAISPPEMEHDKQQFNKLFQYFVDRSRYGVIGKHPLSAVKDTYIIPVEAGAGPKPEFLELLENNTVDGSVPERLLLVALVVKTNNNNNSNPPSGHPTPKEPAQGAASASPLTSTPGTGHHQFGASTGNNNHPQAFSGTGFDGTTTHAQQPTQYSPPAPQYSPPTQQPPLSGQAAAQQVLGHHATSPAVQALLRNAPNADIAQLRVVADILAQNPGAANDFALLMDALVRATSSNR